MQHATKHFITIATFVFPSEMFIARSKLESEGIQCRVLDELTIQSHNFISQAVGGIKLQVESDDILRANSLMLEGGFITSTEDDPTYLQKKVGSPKGIKRLRFFLFILFALIAMITVFWIVFVLLA